ncbi:MAG: sigma-E processing peptidase SpoIIGA [Clostridia bacterium]|nr:sigma-E processing peptidase SpoIIGA [Clostridia bacterium]
MVAYLDLIILENICMNYLILYTAGKLLNRNIKKLRILLASSIGALYVFSLYIDVPNYIVNISKILVAMLLVKISFNSTKIKNITKETIIFLMVSFVYSGCALGFIHFMKPKVIYIVNGIIIGGEYIFELVLISAVVSFLLIKASMKLIKLKQKLTKNDMICKIEIGLNDKSVKINALLDTGNLLTDPISKEPVIIVEKQKLISIIPRNEMDKIENLLGGDEKLQGDTFNARLRAIPYISVGNKNGIMIAYKVDCVKVEYQDEVNELDDVLIGIYNDTLTKNNKYSALFGLQILERSKIKNEYNTDIKNKSKYSVC